MLTNGNEIIEYFNSKYLKLWIDYFQDKKSLKALWESINMIGIAQSSLSSLYSHNKSSWFTRETYICDLVKIQNIDKIIACLKINDENIENALPAALLIHVEKERELRNQAYATYRKKI